MSLCDHVDLEQNKSTVTINRGAAVPFYGWAPELQADVPLLRCPVCDATLRLPGPAVGRSSRVTAANRREEGWELL